MSGVGVRTCGPADLHLVRDRLGPWAGTTRWPPAGLGLPDRAWAELLWGGSVLQQVVTCADEGDIGLVVVHEPDLHDGHAELSLLVAPGAARLAEGLRRVVASAFAAVPVRKLWFQVAVDAFDPRPLLGPGLEHVGRRAGHVRRDATTYADVDLYELWWEARVTT